LGKEKQKRNIPPTSIPPTIFSETARSTVFKPSFTFSVADFCAAKEVEKALGAKEVRNAAVVRRVLRARKDMVIGIYIRDA